MPKPATVEDVAAEIQRKRTKRAEDARIKFIDRSQRINSLCKLQIDIMNIFSDAVFRDGNLSNKIDKILRVSHEDQSISIGIHGSVVLKIVAVETTDRFRIFDVGNDDYTLKTKSYIDTLREVCERLVEVEDLVNVDKPSPTDEERKQFIRESVRKNLDLSKRVRESRQSARRRDKTGFTGFTLRDDPRA